MAGLGITVYDMLQEYRIRLGIVLEVYSCLEKLNLTKRGTNSTETLSCLYQANQQKQHEIYHTSIMIINHTLYTITSLFVFHSSSVDGGLL